jgi:hypothetical protein
MHVYVRLNGWGLQVVPAGDFETEWNEEARNLDMKLYDGRFAQIHVDGAGYRSKLDPRTTKSLGDVVDIHPGETGRYWRVETGLYRFVWPAGYRIACRADQAPMIAVDLLGRNNECIFIQNPRTMPALGQMAGPGQSILDQDDADHSILLGYLLDGVDWRQRHTMVTVGSRDLAVSGQSPVHAFPGVERAMREIVSSIEPTPGW